MKLRNADGICPGCKRAANVCRDRGGCPHRKRFLKMYTKGSEKQPIQESERAVKLWRMGLITGSMILLAFMCGCPSTPLTDEQYQIAHKEACQHQYETTECPVCRAGQCPMRPEE